MADAATYSAIEKLRDGRPYEVRALRPEARVDLLRAVDRASASSLRRRFFSPRRHFAEHEIEFFVNVDFVDHVALVAVVDEGCEPAIVGGARFIVTEPGQAELAFVVVDAYQGQGIGAALMRHLAVLARQSGIKQLVAEVLPENIAMLKVFRKSGLEASMRHGSGVVHVTLALS